MTKAYKCDRCGEYEKGEPFTKVTMKRHLEYLEPGDWTGSRTYELCEDCTEDFHQEFIEE